ncbi:MAG: hypothetical protein J2P57_20060 [Acidimicrobiaceae bacterium]|nr:hypothetical protein [Acidimicrobiaceae bacterium]
MSSYGFPEQPVWEYRMTAQPDVQAPTPALRPMHMVPTNEPVWPADEDLERQELSRSKQKLPDPVESKDVPALGRHVYAKLPDLLEVQQIELTRRSERFYIGNSPAHEVAPADYYFFQIPVSLMTPDDRFIRRISLLLKLLDEQGNPEVGTWTPIVQAMSPDSEFDVRQHNLGTVEVSTAGLQSLVPWLPLGLKLSLPLQWETTQPRIEAFGLMRHKCMWRVSDERIARRFVASAVARVPMHHTFHMSLRLHIELRWKFLGRWRRCYMWNDADRRKFHLDPETKSLLSAQYEAETHVAKAREAIASTSPQLPIGPTEQIGFGTGAFRTRTNYYIVDPPGVPAVPPYLTPSEVARLAEQTSELPDFVQKLLSFDDLDHAESSGEVSQNENGQQPGS